MNNFVGRHRDGNHGKHRWEVRTVAVELELVPIQLVSDPDIETTANQRWSPNGHLASSHVFRVVIVSQWQLILSQCISLKNWSYKRSFGLLLKWHRMCFLQELSLRLESPPGRELPCRELDVSLTNYSITSPTTDSVTRDTHQVATDSRGTHQVHDDPGIEYRRNGNRATPEHSRHDFLRS